MSVCSSTVRDYKDEQQEAAPSTPGMKYRHYAPRSPVYLLMQRSTAGADSNLGAEKVPSVGEAIASILTQIPCAAVRERGEPGTRAVKVGLLSCLDSPLTAVLAALECEGSDRAGSRVQVEWIRHALGGLGEPSVTAHVLFDRLISLDQEGVDVILVEGIEETREGLAVMNRVRKAACETGESPRARPPRQWPGSQTLDRCKWCTHHWSSSSSALLTCPDPAQHCPACS